MRTIQSVALRPRVGGRSGFWPRCCGLFCLDGISGPEVMFSGEICSDCWSVFENMKEQAIYLGERDGYKTRLL